MSSLGYRDSEGARHEVLVRRTSAGDWQVLDTCAAETRVVETLDGREDGLPQAQAVVRDYLSIVERFVPAAGQRPGEPISEQGGADADSDRRPRLPAH